VLDIRGRHIQTVACSFLALLSHVSCIHVDVATEMTACW